MISVGVASSFIPAEYGEIVMVQYDEKIIEAFAEELYREAASLLRNSTLKWSFIGFFAGGIGGAAAGNWENSTNALIAAVLAGAICGAIGYNLAKRRVFALKLQAQTALCQAQIERNTRKGA